MLKLMKGSVIFGDFFYFDFFSVAQNTFWTGEFLFFLKCKKLVESLEMS